jgi:FtsH-binding integral membrane protein
MNYTLTVTGVASVTLAVMALLASRRPHPTATVGPWLFVAAGLAALVGVLYLIQRAYPGEAMVYTTLRVVLAAAMVGTMVRIVLLLR